MKHKAIIRLVLLLTSLTLVGLAVYFSYAAGCAFDWKQGYGDIELGASYAKKDLLYSLGAWAFLSAYLCIKSALTISEIVRLALLAAIMLFPTWFIASFEAEIQGTLACHPR